MGTVAAAVIGAGAQIYSSRQMRKAYQEPETTVEETQRDTKINADAFEEQAKKQKAIARSLRGNARYGGMTSFLNPQNLSKLGG